MIGKAIQGILYTALQALLGRVNNTSAKDSDRNILKLCYSEYATNINQIVQSQM